MKTSTFVTFLQDLSGINNLIPDPHYRGAGIHVTGQGGGLDVHADFNRYTRFGLDRRVNTLLYLNHDWPDAYGGHFELWPRNMSGCAGRVAPLFNRFVAFSTTDFSYHGHPSRMRLPAGRMRRSLALYYYTNGRPANECLNSRCRVLHSTLWQTPRGHGSCPLKGPPVPGRLRRG